MCVKSSAARILASALIVTFPLPVTPPALAATADGTAAISGTLFSATSSTPLAGARLHLKDPVTGASFVSSVAGADGAFDLENVPASSYHLAVESNCSLYVVDAPVRLDADATRHVRVAVRETGRGRGGRADSETPDADKKEGKEKSFWTNPLTATLLVVGGAILVGVIVDQATNEDAPASPSLP